MEYVIHILESCIEEEEDLGSLQDLLSDDQFLTQPDQALFHPLDSLPTSECASRNVESPQVTLKHTSQSCGPMGMGSVVLQVLGFLVDTATGNKVEKPTQTRQTDTCTQRDRDTHTQRQTDRQTYTHRETETQSKADRQTDRTHTHRDRDRQRKRDMDGERDIQTQRETEKERHT